jgi:gliding motility-associated-like protein
MIVFFKLAYFMFHYRLSIVCCFFFFATLNVWAQCPITVDAGDDIYLCAPPTPTQLNGDISGPYLGFNWSPLTGLSGGTSLTPTVTVSQTTTYVLTATAPDFGNNLVDNGDFEGGNSGFTSDYGYNPGDLVPEGLYDVLDNPQDDHPGFAPCDDHTSGSGNMMVVNGAGTPNQDVWCQTVPVTPNTQYVLSAWVTSVVASSPALLQFNINGTPLGGIFNAPGGTCNWQNFFQVWNSAGNTSATICIVNQNTNLGGNDFALDDIVFAPVCTVTDTVKVFVINVNAIAAPSVVTIPCEGATIQISGNGSSTGPDITYEWTTNEGNIVSGANTLTPQVNAPGEYVLTVSYVVNGAPVCTKTATVNVILNPNPLSAWVNPPQPLGCGAPTTILFGNSSQGGFSTYQWSTLDGNIVGNPDQKNITVSQVGTYSLLVTNTNTGCTATADVTVTLTNNAPVANANSNGIITCANDSVPLLGTGSTSGASITYTWTTLNGQIIGPANVLNAIAGAGGTYILNVTNTSNNCTKMDTVVVPANVTPPTVIGTLPPQISCDPNQDTISILILVGPPPIVLINWTTTNGNIVSGQFTPAPQVNLPGTYTVSVLDTTNGCFNYDTIQVFGNFTAPMADILPADTVTCQSPSIQLQGSGSTLGANFSIAWSASNGGNIVSGSNTFNPTVNAAGDYMLILRDSVSLCADTAMVSVLADTNVVMVIANAPDTLNCIVNTVTLNANGSSNSSGISYFWTTTDGNITSGQNSANPIVNAPGTYQLLLTNTINGCAATDLAIVEQNITQPPISITPPGLLTCAILSQTIQAQNSSSAGNYTYQWTASNGGNITAGGNSLSPTVDQAGTYTLIATDLVNGCTRSSSVSVGLDNALPNVATSVPGPLTCTIASQILNANGSSSGPGFTYNWTTVNGTISTGANTPSPTVTAPGIYTLEITNSANGCTASSSIQVLEDITPPTALIMTPSDTLTCMTTQLELIADGTGAGSWTTSNGNILFTAGFFAQIDAPGNYLFTTTDPNNGCTAMANVEIFENVQIPSLSVAPPFPLTCTNTSVTLNATTSNPNLLFSWQTGNGNIVSGQNTAMPIVNTPGNYDLTITDPVNGCSRTGGAIVFQNINPPNIQIIPGGPINCNNLTQTIQGQNQSAGNNFVYEWVAANGGNILSGDSTLTPLINSGGDYILTTTNTVNGCTTVSSINILQDTNLPVASAGADATLSCLTNALTINGSGSGAANLTYVWQASNGGNIVSGGNSPTPLVNQAGTYTLTVSNPVNGCASQDIVEIFTDANAPMANAGTAATLTCALIQTTLNATASTGANIAYNWTAASGGNILNGQNTLTPTVNEPGIYTLAVTNSTNGCIATSSVTVPENVIPPVVDAGAGATLTCAVTNLSLSGISNGGTATYTWTTTNGNILSGNNTLNPSVNQTGTYTLTATLSSNGCAASDQVVVGIDTLAPGFQIAPPLLLTCVQLSTPLSASVQQPGTGNFSAAWTTVGGNILGGQNTLNASADAPGLYILTIQNTLNGCDAQQQVTVNQNIQPPTAIAAPGSDITCAITSLNLSGLGSSTGNMAYSWTASPGGSLLSGTNTLNPTVGSAGTYTLLVTNNATGCSATATTIVGNNTTLPVAAIASPGTLTCLQNSVTLNGTGSSQGANFTASWATSGGNIVSGQGTFVVEVNQIGNYILTVENTQNGCTETAQLLVQEDKNTPGALIMPAGPLHCNLTQATLLGSSSTLGSLTYAWTASAGGNLVSGIQTPTPLIDEPGNYTLKVTNASNGCSSVATLTVTAIPDPVFDPALVQPNCKVQTGVVNFGVVTGGNAPFQYSLDDGQTQSTETLYTGVQPGSYPLVVTDANGCTASESVTIDPPFVADLVLTDILKIEQGDSILLTPLTNIAPNQILSWSWSPATGLSCTDCQQPWAKPLNNQYYKVIVEDLNGCKAEDRILVRVSRNRHIYPPTAFSPNEDGENDRFTLFTKGVREIRSLAIYDRWGEQLFVRKNFQPNDESLGWDGSFRGSPVTPAVFVWAAEVEYIDGEVEVIYGDVTVVR